MNIKKVFLKKISIDNCVHINYISIGNIILDISEILLINHIQLHKFCEIYYQKKKKN